MTQPHNARGRPRDPQVDERILNVTIDLLAGTGYTSLTIGQIAVAAEVSRPTIYRRYATKSALVAAAFEHSLAEANPIAPSTGDVAENTVTVLMNTVASLTKTNFGAAIAELIGPAARDEQLRSALTVRLDHRRSLMRELLERALSESRLLTSVEEGIDLLLGAIYFRHLISHESITRQYVENSVGVVIGAPRQ